METISFSCVADDVEYASAHQPMSMLASVDGVEQQVCELIKILSYPSFLQSDTR